jgi:hypothetical protein
MDKNDKTKVSKSVSLPKVVNIHTDKNAIREWGTVYIGRAQKNPWHFGNPFSHLKNAAPCIHVPTREASITAFEEWLLGTNYKQVEPDRRHWVIKHLWKVKQAKKLACYCAPAPCHGDVLKRLATKNINLH